MQITYPQITPEPAPNVSLMVVIPCCGEPELEKTLNALHQCPLPTGHQAEILVIINESEQIDLASQLLNQQTWQNFPRWQTLYQRHDLAIHAVYLSGIRPKVAGVGLARRFGMDWAHQRFQHTRIKPTIIANLDADCTCESNYLTELITHFGVTPNTPGCSIYFEHPLNGLLAPELYTGITWYELYLRYYRLGLQWAESPYAFHTVGSCFAVRADIYQKVGGMNQRQAGEDFYFIQKLIQQGGYSNLMTTTVYPSPRLSKRVPFGTGAAQTKWLQEPTVTYPTYHPQGFRDLQQLHRLLPVLCQRPLTDAPTLLEPLAYPLQAYLKNLDIVEHLQEIKANSRQLTSFSKRFYQWFNHLKTLQYLHFAKATAYPQLPLLAALEHLGKGLQGTFPTATATPLHWLKHLRQLEKHPVTPPA